MRGICSTTRIDTSTSYNCTAHNYNLAPYKDWTVNNSIADVKAGNEVNFFVFYYFVFRFSVLFVVVFASLKNVMVIEVFEGLAETFSGFRPNVLVRSSEVSY